MRSRLDTTQCVADIGRTDHRHNRFDYSEGCCCECFELRCDGNLYKGERTTDNSATFRRWAQGFVEAQKKCVAPQTNTCEDSIFKAFACDENLLSGTLLMKPLQERIGNCLKHHRRKADLRMRGDGFTPMSGPAHAFLFERRPCRAIGSPRMAQNAATIKK